MTHTLLKRIFINILLITVLLTSGISLAEDPLCPGGTQPDVSPCFAHTDGQSFCCLCNGALTPKGMNGAQACSMMSQNTPINGVCGQAANQSLITTPSVGLCLTGTPTSVQGSGPWSWSCAGLNGGSTASCIGTPANPSNGTGACPFCRPVTCKDQFGNIVDDSLCNPETKPTEQEYQVCSISESYAWDVGAWSECSQDTTCNNGGGISSTGYIDWAGNEFNWFNNIPVNWDSGTAGGRIYNDSHDIIMGCPFLLTSNYNMGGTNVQCFISAGSSSQIGSTPFNGTFYQIFGGNWYTLFVMNDIVISSVLGGSGYGSNVTYAGTIWQSRCDGYNGGFDLPQVCADRVENYRENTNVGCNDIDANSLPEHPGTNTISLCIQAESCELDQPIRTRTVVCKDQGGNGSIVPDSLCSQPKPTTEDTLSCEILPISDLQCGSANNIATMTAPTTNLCTSPAVLSGSVSLVNGSWKWQCRTRGPLGYSSISTNGTPVQECIADIDGECYGWISSATCNAPQQQTTVNYCGSSHGQTFSSLTSSNTNLCAPGAFLQFGSFSSYAHSWEWHCAGSLNPGVTELVSVCNANKTSGTCTLDSTVGGGCFIADTIVTMADGSTKTIQDIKVGDKVKSIDGFNTVISLLRPTLGEQDLYSINNQKSFFTANHPFLTTEGWKSLDPESTKKEIPDLVVSKLNIGDILITENNKILVISISSSTSSHSTQLYNFELDGDHTYFANGFAVHNKYEPGGVDGQLGDSCVYNNDCRTTVAGKPPMACDNNTKTCKYTKPYPSFMCQMDSNGNLTNWTGPGCGDWASPNYVGSGCPTNNGPIDVNPIDPEFAGYVCQANGNWSPMGVCYEFNPINGERGHVPGDEVCTNTVPQNCLCTANSSEATCFFGAAGG